MFVAFDPDLADEKLAELDARLWRWVWSRAKVGQREGQYANRYHRRWLKLPADTHDEARDKFRVGYRLLEVINGVTPQAKSSPTPVRAAKASTPSQPGRMVKKKDSARRRGHGNAAAHNPNVRPMDRKKGKGKKGGKKKK